MQFNVFIMMVGECWVMRSPTARLALNCIRDYWRAIVLVQDPQGCHKGTSMYASICEVLTLPIPDPGIVILIIGNRGFLVSQIACLNNVSIAKAQCRGFQTIQQNAKLRRLFERAV